MFLVNWFFEQKLSDWLQGVGSLAAAGSAVWIALRQERNEHKRAEAARALRRQVLAAAIAPILRDMRSGASVPRTNNRISRNWRFICPIFL